jgi:hypothetical protein
MVGGPADVRGAAVRGVGFLETLELGRQSEQAEQSGAFIFTKAGASKMGRLKHQIKLSDLSKEPLLR